MRSKSLNPMKKPTPIYISVINLLLMVPNCQLSTEKGGNAYMQRQTLLKLGAVVIVGSAFLVANYFNPFDKDEGTRRLSTNQPGKINVAQPGTNAANPVTEITVTPQTKVYYQVKYQDCGHVETLEQKPTQDLIGLSEAAVKDVFEGWSVDNFNKEKVTLTLPVEGACSQCADKLYLGIKDGYVAIYQGVPGKGTTVKKKTAIDVADLPETERTKLQQGIVVESEQEALEILEGLASLTED